MSNTFVSGVFDVLGQERGELLENCSSQWMADLGLRSGPNDKPNSPISLTIKRYQSGDETRLGFEFSSGGGTMSTDISPWQAVPEPFQSLFPGGWPDIARHIGVTLPKDFNQR